VKGTVTKSSTAIYHNPHCGNSRRALELLREKGVHPHIPAENALSLL